MMDKTATITTILLLCTLKASTDAFQVPPALKTSPRTSLKSMARISPLAVSKESVDDQEFDVFLSEGKLKQAVKYFREHPSLSFTRDRWSKVFDSMEERLRQGEVEDAKEKSKGQMPAQGQLFPLITPARAEMTEMYSTLKELEHLVLFGAVDTKEPLAAGSHIVTPKLLEEISGLTMKALTPRPSNSLLYAGILLSGVEAAVSLTTGIDFNVLVGATILAALADQVLVNGGVSDGLIKLFNPALQDKIRRHEAGHFLCAYLLGCPVEGYVLSPWAAREDARFEKAQLSAGTSFFDPVLSEQINSSVVSRSSLDRYSIIVMGGIAAEALLYGQADGGAGDEAALVSFLSQLNGRPKAGQMPPWNEVSIRNQARWGALQAVMMIKEYRPCYDALVDALERGGSLGDCTYAIERAGREHNLLPVKKPLGYIEDKGMFGEWTKEKPGEAPSPGLSTEQQRPAVVSQKTKEETQAETLATLAEYRNRMEERLREIDEALASMDA